MTLLYTIKITCVERLAQNIEMPDEDYAEWVEGLSYNLSKPFLQFTSISGKMIVSVDKIISIITEEVSKV